MKDFFHFLLISPQSVLQIEQVGLSGLPNILQHKVNILVVVHGTIEDVLYYFVVGGVHIIDIECVAIPDVLVALHEYSLIEDQCASVV